MNTHEYLIMVEVPARGQMQDLVKALQEGYDQGHAAGHFRVISTRLPGYMVTFLRTTANDDLEYLKTRLRDGSPTIEHAAMHQLGLELSDVVGNAAKPVVMDLLHGDAQVIDFYGVLAQYNRNAP
jgi:hypothetical protein